MRRVLVIIIAVVITALVLVGLKALLFPFNTVEKSIGMAYDITNQTLNGEEAIYNYEWFITQEAYIRECYKNEEIAKEEWDYFLSVLPEDRTTWTSQDKQEESSLRNSYYALQKLTNKAIEEYNARSEMVNRAIFKDNLPANITRAYLTGLELTK